MYVTVRSHYVVPFVQGSLLAEETTFNTHFVSQVYSFFLGFGLIRLWLLVKHNFCYFVQNDKCAIFSKSITSHQLLLVNNIFIVTF